MTVPENKNGASKRQPPRVTSAQLQPLLSNLQRQAEDFREGDTTSEESLLAAAKKIVFALEHPVETLSRIAFVQPMICVTTVICLDLNIFELLVEGDGEAKHSDELARESGCDPVLMARMLKQLALDHIIEEVGPDTYIPTQVSRFLATPPGRGIIVSCFNAVTTTNAKLPEYFRQRRYKNATDSNDSPWQFANNTKQHYFDWLYAKGNEYEAKAFADHMELKTYGPKWFDVLPVEEILGHPDDPNVVLLVDVGGASGYDITNFHRAHPNLPGRLVLQDLPGTLGMLKPKELAPVELMPHDFFTEQPVKGARAYYLKMVLHDWPDDKCLAILQNLRPALAESPSKILINEMVIPPSGANWFEASLDMLMMTVHAAGERREQQWRSLVERAGLKITKIWDCGAAAEKLIEVELA